MLELFKPVPVVSETYPPDALPARAQAYARDTITLGWEARLKTRARRRSDSGSEFATTLPRGTVLRAGDALVVDAIALVAIVVEREEAVFVVRPKDPAEWGLFGYHIGNSHQPVMITGTAIVCADLPGMAQILELHGIPFTRETQAFTPVSGLADHRHAG
jgi:urease accessory protein UreE